MMVSDSTGETLITYGLGSCVGLTLFDPFKRVGGLVHCMLPLSRVDRPRAEERPCLFVDTGIPVLLQALIDRGAKKRNLIACIAGAARLLDDSETFNVGERNLVVAKKVLWKNNVLVSAEDVGGNIARTMALDMSTGATMLKSHGKQWVMQQGDGHEKGKQVFDR